MVDPLDALLEKLCSGDSAAAEQAFLACEPYLRLVVHRQLPAEFRSRLDSADVVQSVWADALRGFKKAGWRFADARHLRAFLVTMVRNRLRNRIRQHARSVKREHSLAATATPYSHEPTPSEVVQAEDLWEQMLKHCDPAHHELLRLKRQGYTLTEIAERTGLHPSSVRRILYDLVRRLAAG